MTDMKKLLILPALLALSACGDSPAEGFAKAKSAFAAHDYAAARVHLAAALSAEPGDKAMLLLQAKTLLALGDGEGAGSALALLVGAGPAQGELAELSAEAALLRQVPDVSLTLLGSADSAEAERLRAIAALQKSNTQSAGDHFAKAVDKGGSARVFADYARFRLMAGDVAGAIDMADRAVKADPVALDTLLIKGQLAVQRGDLKTALDTYQRARKLYPVSLAAMLGEAATLGDLGRTDEMKRVIATAAAFAPSDPAVAYLSARAAIDSKDWAGARAAVQPVETKLPQIHPLRVLYGEALLRLGQNELAIAQLGPVARAQPNNRVAVRLFAEAQLAAGDARAATETLRPIADQPMARTEELLLMAKAAAAAGDPKAASYQTRANRPAVQSLGADLAEADAAMRKGDWAKAVVAYDRIISQTDGRNVVVLNNLAYAQSMLGEHAKARTFADRALKLAPDNASVMDTAGWVRFRAGQDLETAKRLLRQAAEKAPQNAAIRAHLAEAVRAG
jgi:tetratricopeptide (TPR) repeat protein